MGTTGAWGAGRRRERERAARARVSLSPPLPIVLSSFFSVHLSIKAYGTVPIVHAVGGLRDTVSPFNPFDDTGTGWTFDRADGRALRDAVANALHTYRAFRPSFDAIGQRGADQDLSWDVAAATYEEVLVAAKYQW